MTVTELIARLQVYEATGMGNVEVKFAYNYGDYWSTQVAADVDSVEQGEVKYSDYHQMDKVVETDDEDVEVSADTTTVILLG